MTLELARTNGDLGGDLAPVDQAKRFIARAIADDDVESLFELRAMASAAELARTRVGAQEAANEAGEIKVRAERGLAILDVDAAPNGVTFTGGRKGDAPLEGLHGNTRASIRKLAKLTDDEFEERLEDARNDEVAGVSTRRVLQAPSVHFSSQSDEWGTPQDLFDHLNEEFSFELDVCASQENHKCPTFYTSEDDGLSKEWRGTCWMNPPYGSVDTWMEKARESAKYGATVVCLVPARTDTRWWRASARVGEVRFLSGRLKFGESTNSAPFPSCVIVLGPGLESNIASSLWEWAA